MDHLTESELEALVMGITEGVSEARRRHLAACNECARRLAREARVELDIYDALSSTATPAVARAEHSTQSWQAGIRRVALPVAAALALTAVAVRFLAPQDSPAPLPPPAAAPGSVAGDTPCLVDPRGLGPGHDVIAPRELCRTAVSPLGPGSNR